MDADNPYGTLPDYSDDDDLPDYSDDDEAPADQAAPPTSGTVPATQ